MIEEKNKLDEGGWRNILFHPEELHEQWIKNFEDIAGKEISAHFHSSYEILRHAIAISNNWPQHRKTALIPLSDGFSSLVCVVNNSVLGFALQPCLLLRYYLEGLGLSYGIFYDRTLFERWVTNANNDYANRITKQGINLLSSKYSHFKELWSAYSEISHFSFSSTGASILASDSIAVSGIHSTQRDKMIKQNIRSAETLILVTGKLIKEDYLMEN